ncbi:CRISPR associated protein Cas1 [Pseudoxanthobacter soli DSM 19599]|uniref:CRISPR associated protein Cas1 n=1 Tax=Pseudoxanthobacter soli DSM 19599 TaxID=1123029 RepID=A0A1M7ZMA2_9HYPH|nr:CRISPR-associated endonuclease Cas1 [Pseudoxanthobacter soli]SHO66007.1 CRISPR associated protein Cas1 [Pseudoxanthobacter soli DSM 19599]
MCSTPWRTRAGPARRAAFVGRWRCRWLNIASVADRLALSLINRRQLRASDFELRDAGAVFLSDEARKKVLTAWQERKKDERQHPFLEEKAPLGLTPYLQAQMLARHLRGDLDAYPPWFWK